MSKEIYVALIGAAVSFVLAVWSLATARISKSLALAAEERAKRGELVRVKALDAIDALLESIADLLSSIEWLHLVFDDSGGVKMDQLGVQENLKKFAEKREVVKRLRVKSSPYLTHELMKQVDSLTSITKSLNMNQLDEIEKQLRDISESISSLAREKYLD